MKIASVFPGKRFALGKVFLFCLLNACVFILPFIIQGKGMYIVVDDFVAQQIPFGIYCNDAIKAGETCWSWYTDLGANFIGAYAFYTLGSPFYWLSLLFPSAWYPYVIGPLLILKYAVAGTTAYLFVSRYIRNKQYALFAAVLYAFSGFQTSNLFYNHFHDVVALFPLMLWALDELVENRRHGLFAAVTALLALTNYFFLVGEVVCVILYFILRYLVVDFRHYIRLVPLCLLEGIIGGMVSCVLLLPAALATARNPRTSWYIWDSGIDSLFQSKENFLKILEALLFPPEMQPHYSVLTENDYASCAAYLPFVGVGLTWAWLRKRGSWLRRILLIFAVMAASPLLNSLFYGFKSTVYMRWYYMPTLFMALASAKALEELEDAPLRKSAMAGLIATAVLSLILGIYPLNCELFSGIVRQDVFLVLAIGAMAGAIGTYLVLRFCKHPSARLAMLFVGVLLFADAYPLWEVHYMHTQRGDGYTAENMVFKYGQAGKMLEFPQQQDYRIRGEDLYWDIAQVAQVPADHSFISTVNGSIFRLYETMGLTRWNPGTQFPEECMEALDLLFNVRFTVQSWINYSKRYQDSASGGDLTYYLYAKDDFIPMGCGYRYYVRRSSLEGMDAASRIQVMLHAIVLEDEQVPSVSGYLTEIPTQYLYLHTQETQQDAVVARRKLRPKDFTRDTHGFTCDYEEEDAFTAFYAVCWDEGWSATLDGDPVDIIEASGLMALNIPAGTHHVAFTYTVPGLSSGWALTTLGIFLLIAEILLSIFLKKRKTQRQKPLDSCA